MNYSERQRAPGNNMHYALLRATFWLQNLTTKDGTLWDWNYQDRKLYKIIFPDFVQIGSTVEEKKSMLREADVQMDTTGP